MLIPYKANVNTIENVSHVDKATNPRPVTPIDIGIKKPAAKPQREGFQPFQHYYNYYVFKYN